MASHSQGIIVLSFSKTVSPYGRVRLARFARTTLTPHFTDFFTDFEKKTDCFAVYSEAWLNASSPYLNIIKEAIKMKRKSYRVSSLFGMLACTTDKTKPLVKSVCKPAPKPLLWAPNCVLGFECVIWLACEKAIVYLPIRLKQNSKGTSRNSLSPLGPRERFSVLLCRLYLPGLD